MRTLASQLTKALTAEVVQKAVVTVKRMSLTEKRALDAAIKIASPPALNRLKYLSEKANRQGGQAVTDEAKKALLDFVGRHTNPAYPASHLTVEQFIMLDSYCNFSLDKVPNAKLGKTAMHWKDPASIYEYCLSLHKADEWESRNIRWC